MLYWDYLLTLSDEIKYVWRQPFRFNTLLYIFTRYALLANLFYLGGLLGVLTPYVNFSLASVSC